jgi:hypothetical protein
MVIKPGQIFRRNATTPVSTSIPEGAGTELKKLLLKLRLNPAPNCKCNVRMNTMNLNGCDWCEQNIDTITEWLREEAQRANLPFVSTGAKIIIKRAIHNARKKEKHRQKQQTMLQGQTNGVPVSNR